MRVKLKRNTNQTWSRWPSCGAQRAVPVICFVSWISILKDPSTKIIIWSVCLVLLLATVGPTSMLCMERKGLLLLHGDWRYSELWWYSLLKAKSLLFQIFFWANLQEAQSNNTVKLLDSWFLKSFSLLNSAVPFLSWVSIKFHSVTKLSSHQKREPLL